MAKKARKSAPRKKAAVRRGTRRAAPARRRSARRRVTKAGMDITIKDLAFAVGGAMLADAYVDKIAEKMKIVDPKVKYGGAAAVSVFAAMRVPREYKPFFIGSAIAMGGRAVNVIFPNLIPKTTGGGKTTLPSSNGQSKGLTSAMPKTIGRRTAEEEQRIRDRVVSSLDRRFGPINGSTFSPINGSRFSPVNGRRRRSSIYS